MSEYQFLDELIKEFLVFRGFTSTLKYFDLELKYEKEKGFRVDRVLEGIHHHISTHDLSSLLDTWKHFETSLFSKLEPSKNSSVKKLEASLLKLYLVYCFQNKQQDKIKEFFERLTPELQSMGEWKDWFALPYIKEPQENPLFSIYFSRQWQDTLMISLHNFLMLCFQSLPPPRLADFQKTSSRIRMLKEELKILKLKLVQFDLDEDQNLSSGNLKYFEPPPPQDIMDDFFLIAQEAGKTETQIKSIKSFLKNITGGQKKSPNSQPSVVRSKVAQSMGSLPKTPLKRMSLTASRPSSTSLTARTDLSIQADQEDPETKEPTFPDKKDDLTSLLQTPGTPATRFLLLGQEEYHEHRSSVSTLKVSPFGLVASADVSGVIKIWSSGANQPSTKATFISASPVSCLSWIDERRLVYGTQLGQVRMCDVEEKCLVLETACSSLSGQRISALATSPTGGSFFVASPNKALIINTKSLSVDRELNDQLLIGATAAQYNHNGSLLVFATNQGQVGIFDLHRNESLAVWSGHTEMVYGLELSSDETTVWTTAKDGRLLQSSLLRPGDEVWSGELNTGGEYFGDFAVSPDNEHILAGTDSGAVVYRIGVEGEMVKVLGIRGDSPITSVHWGSGDCGTILASSLDGAVKISTLLHQ